MKVRQYEVRQQDLYTRRKFSNVPEVMFRMFVKLFIKLFDTV